MWYRTTNDTASNPPDPAQAKYGQDKHLDYLNAVSGTDQPILIPIPQIQITTVDRNNSRTFESLLINSDMAEQETQWVTKATGSVTTNMVMATGDNPSRPASTGVKASLNGGLANLTHFIENWREGLTPTLAVLSFN